VAPVIPGLTDHEIPAILEAAAMRPAHVRGLRRPAPAARRKRYSSTWLEAHFPDRREKVLEPGARDARRQAQRSRTSARACGAKGAYADQIRALFHAACRRASLNRERVELSVDAFRRPDPRGQLGLFDG
jgi:DNA repair photolyase